MKIAALIPAYKEEKHIAEVVERTRRHLPDVLVIDDGSGDRTGEIAAQAGAKVRVNAWNMGKGASLIGGLDHLFADGYDAVMCLDADGQHLPEEIPRFLEACQGADLVIGSRLDEAENMPKVRLWTNQFTSWLISKLAGVRVPDTQCGFRMVRREAWRGVTIVGKNYDFEGEMIIAMGRNGSRITSVPVTTVYGDEVSSINPVVDTVRFFRMIWRLWLKRQA